MNLDNLDNVVTIDSRRGALPPHNPDRTDRYYYPDEMGGASREFTFLVNFTAHDEAHAQMLAERYARGLNQMRLEVDPYTARISPGSDLSNILPVCCLVKGPDPSDLCTELAGHGCPHNGPGATGTWNDDRVPRGLSTVD